MPHKVKLPPFWEKDAAASFKLAEAILEDNRVRDLWVMCRTVILHIPYHVLERARGVLSLVDTHGRPLQGDEGQTCRATHPQGAGPVHQHLVGAEVGGRRPTELMEVLLASLPMGEQPGKLFKTVFLHRLPWDLKDVVAIQFQQLKAMELAKFADIIWDARNSKKAVVTVVRTAPTEEATAPMEEKTLEKAVMALTILSKKRWQSGRSGSGGPPRGGQGDSRSGGQGKKSLCERHERLGDDTWHCDNPRTCSWMGNK